LVPLNFKSVGGARRGAVVSWENDDCLAQTVTKGVMMMANGSLASQNSCPSCNSVWTFSKSFNARQLTRLAGFDIIWTSNLLDHLLVQDEDEKLKVHVFHHVKVLENHLTIKKSVLDGKLEGTKSHLSTQFYHIPRVGFGDHGHASPYDSKDRSSSSKVV
jgi:hypothetical protein